MNYIGCLCLINYIYRGGIHGKDKRALRTEKTADALDGIGIGGAASSKRMNCCLRAQRSIDFTEKHLIRETLIN